MKVALIQCPVWWTVDPPLGLAQVAGCARHFGHEPRVFDLNVRLWKERPPKYDQMWSWEQFQFWNRPETVRAFFEDHRALIEGCVQEILRTDAGVIGFSVCSGSQWSSLELSRMIKNESPGRTIVWGGQFFFLGDRAKEWIQRPEVDAIVRGPGDFALPRILQEVERSGGLPVLPGALVKHNGGIVDGGPALPVRNLDEVPFPDLTGFPMDLYTDLTRIPIAASRGCVWGCRFCSTREFWDGYSYMSGDRIFAELQRQKMQFPRKTHVEFYDITANGNVKSLGRFSELLIDEIRTNGWQYGWKINAVLRPEMDRRLLAQMARSRCIHVIYGLESGSPRVLKAMNKPLDLPVAERVLRDTHEAGIGVTVNVMFGFPGEEEQDFKMTLDFLRRNRPWLDRAYGSATFTSLEEHSYLTGHAAEFGIKPMGDRFHHLYWETGDGKNDYRTRWNRYKRFRETAAELGIDAYKGVNGTLEQSYFANLAEYQSYRGRHLDAIHSYLAYLELDFYNQPMRERLKSYLESLDTLVSSQGWLEKKDLRRVERLLDRFPDYERPEVLMQDAEMRIRWGTQVLPSRADVRRLRDRARMFLFISEQEIRRGEAQKEVPQCRR